MRRCRNLQAPASGSRWPSEFADRMAAAAGNALALTRQGDCITMWEIYLF